MADEAEPLDLESEAEADESDPSAPERRRVPERRKQNVPVAVDRRKGGDRRDEGRRRQVDPTTCERDYDNEEVIFMRAMDDYKREFNRPFPTWTEVLEVFKSLGYRKVAEKSAIVANRAKAQKLPD